MRAHEVKLLAHRWDLHAIQALASRDFELLTRVFKELPVPEGAINSRVKTFGFGAPAQFHSYGFFDKGSAPNCSSAAAPMLEHVAEGDSLLLISMCQCDPQSAAVLVNAGASLIAANRVGESPIQLIFKAYATIKLDDMRRQQQLPEDNSSSSSQQSIDDPTAEERRVLDNHAHYRTLFVLVQEQIDCYYGAMKAKIRKELEDIYTQSAPERLAKLQAQLQDFEFKEHLLLASVRRKYLE